MTDVDYEDEEETTVTLENLDSRLEDIEMAIENMVERQQFIAAGVAVGIILLLLHTASELQQSFQEVWNWLKTVIKT